MFRTIVANKIKCRTKALIDWTTTDVVKWLKNMGLEDVIVNVQNASLDGQKLLTLSEEQICCGLDLSKSVFMFIYIVQHSCAQSSAAIYYHCYDPYASRKKQRRLNDKTVLRFF